MASRTSKPPLTGAFQTLSFEKLSPADFERLCLWLVKREGYPNPEHLGEAGSEQGRDVVAWKDGQRVVFQCKRVKAFSTTHAAAEIEKLRKLPVAEQPHVLVFLVSHAVSADTRRDARAAWGDEATCQFWAGNELDERVKRYPEILREFFQLPANWVRASLHHNLPYPSLGPLFQGRDEILTWLHQTLKRSPAGRATAIAGKAVHGLGGVGKTRLAVEYAWKHAEEYSALLFVGSGSPAALRHNLAALSESLILDLPEKEVAEEAVREVAVIRWLKEHSGWLLILDNVDSEDAAAAVDGLIALLHGGHVLLTGRMARWSAEVEPIELDVLTEETAIRFLLSRTNGRRRGTKEDNAHANTLAHELGCLPLALEQASAYIADRRLTLAGYLGKWKSRRDQVLTWFDSKVSHYPASVAVTWQTSFDRLSTPARRLLERLAWLSPEAIPESLLDVPIPDLEGSVADDAQAFLGQLGTYSLVIRAEDGPSFTVHRLVQDVTRRSLGDHSRAATLIEALCWVNAAFKGNPQDVRTWPTLDPLAPHARSVVAFSDAAGIADPTALLMNNLGQLFDAKALRPEAEPLMRRALAIDEQTFGATHPNVAIRLNDLALLLKATNRLAEAEPMMRRALLIDEQTGETQTVIARDLSNLALLLKDTNRLTEAEPLMRRALDIDEKSVGANHPNVARDLSNLALLLQDTNRLTEAESLMRRALDIDEKNFQALHPNGAIRLNNLALLLKATNRHAEAEPLFRRALDIDEESFGALHPEVATDLNNLALVLKDTGRLAEAEPLMRRALGINEQSFGEFHPAVATNLYNLARLLKANRLAEAEPLMRRALDIVLEFERLNGYEHPHRVMFSNNYEALLRELGETDAAPSFPVPP